MALSENISIFFYIWFEYFFRVITHTDVLNWATIIPEAEIA